MNGSENTPAYCRKKFFWTDPCLTTFKLSFNRDSSETHLPRPTLQNPFQRIIATIFKAKKSEFNSSVMLKHFLSEPRSTEAGPLIYLL